MMMMMTTTTTLNSQFQPVFLRFAFVPPVSVVLNEYCVPTPVTSTTKSLLEKRNQNASHYLRGNAIPTGHVQNTLSDYYEILYRGRDSQVCSLQQNFNIIRMKMWS